MKNKWIGILQIVFSSLSFSFMFLLVKQASNEYSFIELSFFRGLINALFVLPVLIVQRERIFVARPWGLLLRSFAGFISLVFYFISISKLKLSDAVAINSTVPLGVTVFLFAFGKPRPRWNAVLWVLLGLAGVLLILKPEFGFFNVNGLWGLVGVVFASIAFLALHSVAKKYHPELIVFYFTSLTTLFLLPFVPSFIWPSRLTGWIPLIGIGALAAVAQALMTRGYARLPILLAAELQQLSVIFSALLGWSFLNEKMGWPFFVGAFAVLVACSRLLRLNSASQIVLDPPSAALASK